MIAKSSALVLDNFCVVNTKCVAIPPKAENPNFNPIEVTESFPVNIEFEIEKEENSENHRIIVTIEINNKAEFDGGYSILAEGIGFFSFDKKNTLEEKTKAQLLQVSALSICISNLRLYIANLTSYYPWGSFSFHAVDMGELLKEKAEFIENNKSKKEV